MIPRSGRITRGMKIALIAFALSIAGAIGFDITVSLPTALAQTRNNAKNIDKAGKFITEIGAQVAYSPDDLGVNALTLPASNVTPNSAFIDMSGVKEATIFSKCGQIYDLRIAIFAEDKTTLLGTYAVVTANPSSATYNEFSFGNESPANTVGGTLAIAGLRTPMGAMQLVFNNTTATPSTCTARAFVQY